MKKNMGNLDRVIRVMVALIMVALYAMQIVTGTFGIILIVLAVVFALTSVFSFCPLYLPFGFKTNKD